MKKCSGEKGILVAALLLCFVGIGITGVFDGSLRAGEDRPTIVDMLLEVARTEARDEVLQYVEGAAERLEAGDPYGAKVKIMRLKATVELTHQDYRVLDPLERKVDEALGEDLEEVVEEVEQKLREEELLTDYRRQKRIEEQLKRRMAEALVEEASTELYQRQRPGEALRLAREAFALDPQNEEAERLIVDAEVELGEDPARRDPRTLSEIARARVESLKQEYTAVKRRAIDHQRAGEYEEAKEVWNNARTLANVLSVYTDMDEELELVETQHRRVAEEVERMEREREARLARLREEEIEAERRRQEEERRAREELEAEQEAEKLNAAWSHLRRGRYTEARRIVDELLAVDSTNEGALFLQQIITDEEHDDLMRRLVRRREREDLALIRQSYDRATAPGDEIRFPDKDIWNRIAQRAPVGYPTEEVERLPEEIDVERQLDEFVILEFPDAGRQNLVDVINEIHRHDNIDVQIIPNRGAFEDRRPPGVTADFRARLRVALNHLVNEGSRSGYPLAWRVEGENILIDHPDALRDPYELRIYDIRDLLVSVTDAIGDAPTRTTTTRNDWDRTTTDRDWDRDWDRDRYDDPRTTRTDRTRDRGRATQESPGLYDRAEELRRLIQSVIEPGRWGERDVEEEDVDEENDWNGGWDTQPERRRGNNDGEVGERPYIDYRPENPGDFLIIQTAEVHERIEALLSRLREAIHIQVHVETRFVEVTEEFLQEVGVRWDNIDFTPDFRPGDSGARLSADIGTGIPVFPERTADPTRGMRFDFGIFEGVEMEGFLKAVQMSDHSRVVQTPSITLMNTQRGELWIRTEQSYIYDYTHQEIGDVPVYDAQIEMIEDGIRLDIRPIVSSCRRYVYLEMRPEVDTVLEFEEVMITVPGREPVFDEEGRIIDRVDAPIELPVQHPLTLIQEFQNTVAVPDRGLLVVGGLGRTTERDRETGIPVLNKIPLLKRVFGSEGKRREDQTLIILVRPRIIILDEEEQYAF